MPKYRLDVDSLIKAFYETDYTYRTFADKIGKSPSLVRDMTTHGDLKNIQTLFNVCEALDIDPRDLIKDV